MKIENKMTIASVCLSDINSGDAFAFLSTDSVCPTGHSLYIKTDHMRQATGEIGIVNLETGVFAMEDSSREVVLIDSTIHVGC